MGNPTIPSNNLDDIGQLQLADMINAKLPDGKPVFDSVTVVQDGFEETAEDFLQRMGLTMHNRATQIKFSLAEIQKERITLLDLLNAPPGSPLDLAANALFDELESHEVRPDADLPQASAFLREHAKSFRMTNPQKENAILRRLDWMIEAFKEKQKRVDQVLAQTKEELTKLKNPHGAKASEALRYLREIGIGGKELRNALNKHLATAIALDHPGHTLKLDPDFPYRDAVFPFSQADIDELDKTEKIGIDNDIAHYAALWIKFRNPERVKHFQETEGPMEAVARHVALFLIRIAHPQAIAAYNYNNEESQTTPVEIYLTGLEFLVDDFAAAKKHSPLTGVQWENIPDFSGKDWKNEKPPAYAGGFNASR